MKTFMEKVENGEWVTDQDLLSEIEAQGKENIRFIVLLPKLAYSTPFGFGIYRNDDREETCCKIDESQYQLKDKYKITVRPENDAITNGHEHFYISDFISLIREGKIKIQ